MTVIVLVAAMVTMVTLVAMVSSLFGSLEGSKAWPFEVRASGREEREDQNRLREGVSSQLTGILSRWE